jgi:hypothetical protein
MNAETTLAGFWITAKRPAAARCAPPAAAIGPDPLPDGGPPHTPAGAAVSGLPQTMSGAA